MCVFGVPVGRDLVRFYFKNFFLSKTCSTHHYNTNICSKLNRLKRIIDIYHTFNDTLPPFATKRPYRRRTTMQKKMGDYVTTTPINSKKRSPGKNEENLESKKPKLSQADLSKINFDCDKKNAKDQDWNLKIISWNVAGLRAWIKKDVIEYLKKEDPDIMCFQEIKCLAKQWPNEARLPGYTMYINSADKPGYSGVALYTKKIPSKVRMGTEITELNDTEGRVIEAEYDQFFLVATYIPNAGAGLKTLPKRMQWDEQFRNYLKGLDKIKPVVLTGDLNVAHNEIDLANPKTNTKNAGFTKEERDNFSLLLDQGFVDTFRTLNPTKTGAYTFWSYFANSRSRNTGWRLDYFVTSKRFMENVCDSTIRSEILGSDHCPVVFYVNV